MTGKEAVRVSHAERYLSLIERTKGRKLSTDYWAAFYLLSSTPEIYEIAAEQVGPEGIGFASISRSAKSLGESEARVVSIARNLFKYYTKTDATPFEISRLGYPFMELACNGIFIASGEAKVRTMSTEKGLELYLDMSKYEKTKKFHEEYSQSMENAVYEAEELER